MAVVQTLTLTEVSGSVNTSANTSKVNILWKSTQSGESFNAYTRTAKYYVSINGGAETEYSVSYTLQPTFTQIIINHTITVPHRDDGTGTVTVRTWMDTRISAGVIEKSQTLTLTTIPRASTIEYAAERKLGEYCYIKWTPFSKDFRYKLKFALGTNNETTSAIHPNTKSPFAYEGLKLSLQYAVAMWALGELHAYPMTVTLYTYSDSACTVLVGSSSTKFNVTVPENEDTKPNVTMTLSSVPSYTGFEGIYLQGRSKVKATFSGSGKFGANIVSYSMKVGANNYSDPYTSGVLGTSGDITISGIATDTRGFTRTVTQTITVHSYDKPAIITHTGENKIICRRCLFDGTPDEEGTYLLIKMGRKYNKVLSGGVQKNFCTLSYRYKTDSQPISAYSDPITILGADASSDYISTVIPNVVSNISAAYNIQLIAEDTVGESDVVTITVPSSFVTAHAPEGGHGITFGGYHDPSKVDVFDCKFDAEFHGAVRGSVLGLQGCSGVIPSDGDLNDYRVPGVYAVNKDADAEQIANMPPLVRHAGLLKVYASIGQDDVNEGTWKYITQEYRSRIPSTPEYRRRLWTDGTGTWQYSAWVSGIDDVVHLAGDATKVVAYTYKESDVEICQLAIYQGESYHFLQLTPTGIKYGKDGKVIWTK